jgi:hypothetical protein
MAFELLLEQCETQQLNIFPIEAGVFSQCNMVIDTVYFIYNYCQSHLRFRKKSSSIVEPMRNGRQAA